MRLVGFGLAVSGSIQAADPKSGQRFEADRIVAFGDVHGDHAVLVRLLRAADVVDDDLRWAAGTTHLVSLGDLLDRGPGSIAILDLLMRLQDEAATAGGRVHMVLGNHELMNLIGDLRYVPAAEFAAFAGTGTGTGTGATESTLAARPAGYVERYQAFTPTGRYGRWLLAQPAAVIVNDTLFVHGGLPPTAAALGLDALNRTVATRLDELLALRTALETAAIIAPHGDVQANAMALKAARAALTADPAQSAPGNPDDSGLPPAAFAPLPLEREAQVTRFIELAEDALFSDGGVMWYRGTALCHDQLERPVLETGLAQMQAKRVVVGHTPTWDNRVRARFGGLAILADTGMLHAYYRGQPAALIIEGAATRVLYADDPTAVAAPDPRAGLEFELLDSTTVERVLGTGALIAEPTEPAESRSVTTEPGTDTPDQNGASTSADARATLPPGTTLVSVTEGDMRVTALFEPGSRAEVERQLAAYQLDRLLGLGLVVPVAERQFDGKRGVLSARWTRTVDEQARAAAKLSRSNWCARGNDYQLMYVFDALANNRGRTPNTMLYDRRTWQFASAGHANTFGRGRDLPPYLASAPKVLPPALADALRSLNDDNLQQAIGGLLPKPQLRAILQRRDDLLATWTIEDDLP